MKVKQFEDKNLSHYSYAIISNGLMAVIDPARDPQPYYDFAAAEQATISAIIETHPHADFVSSHLEMHETTGAPIYVSKMLGAEYPHLPFDEGQTILLGTLTLSALNTPGHSADSITVILKNEDGKDLAAFTGDTLFIGDCGRPDLREKTGKVQQKREELARQMYHSLKKFLVLDDSVSVYPAHGSGSLCGRALSEESRSTIGNEKTGNWCLQPMNENDFVTALLEGQPFIPKYFGYDVDLNRKGAPAFSKGIEEVGIGQPVLNKSQADQLHPDVLMIDARPAHLYKEAHLKNAINIPGETKFETWLGSTVAPSEPFYLAAENDEQLKLLISRTAKIGYESFIEAAFVLEYGDLSDPEIDLTDFKKNRRKYTIIDVRNSGEAKKKIFTESINIPLYELREKIDEIPQNQPVVVHCYSGYRSAIANSIINKQKGHVKSFDLSKAVKDF